MKIFYLQRLHSTEAGVTSTARQFIDDHLHDGHEQLKSVEAASWKLAKQALMA